MPPKFRLKWIEARANRRAERRSIARLQGFSDRMLNDIGVSRSSVGYPPKLRRQQPW
ncbi:MAG: DUF1127 domain-containing protein [Rhodobacteraceae bacterium]|nr:DUF1127 domain-containing protein [Paracoccaceae bacterium]